MYSHHGIFTDRYISRTILARKYIDQSGKPTDLKMLFLTLKVSLSSFFFNLILLMRLYTGQSFYILVGKVLKHSDIHVHACMPSMGVARSYLWSPDQLTCMFCFPILLFRILYYTLYWPPKFS